MAVDKQELVDGFKESLKDLAVILEKLVPHCETMDELIASIKHGLESDVHLSLIMSVVSKKR